MGELHAHAHLFCPPSAASTFSRAGGARLPAAAHVEDGFAVMTVADSGCGIGGSDLNRIFGRFARAQPRRSREAGGFGLGLAIVQAIAEAHGGSVGVDSTVCRGSVFGMLLPLAPVPAQPRAQTSATRDPGLRHETAALSAPAGGASDAVPGDR